MDFTAENTVRLVQCDAFTNLLRTKMTVQHVSLHLTAGDNSVSMIVAVRLELKMDS